MVNPWIEWNKKICFDNEAVLVEPTRIQGITPTMRARDLPTLQDGAAGYENFMEPLCTLFLRALMADHKHYICGFCARVRGQKSDRGSGFEHCAKETHFKCLWYFLLRLEAEENIVLYRRAKLHPAFQQDVQLKDRGFRFNHLDGSIIAWRGESVPRNVHRPICPTSCMLSRGRSDRSGEHRKWWDVFGDLAKATALSASLACDVNSEPWLVCVPPPPAEPHPRRLFPRLDRVPPPPIQPRKVEPWEYRIKFARELTFTHETHADVTKALKCEVEEVFGVASELHLLNMGVHISCKWQKR